MIKDKDNPVLRDIHCPCCQIELLRKRTFILYCRKQNRVFPTALISYPIVNQVVHPPEIEATSSSDTKLVGIGRVEAEERHVARKNSFDNLWAGLVRTVSNSTCQHNCKTDCPKHFDA